MSGTPKPVAPAMVPQKLANVDGILIFEDYSCPSAAPREKVFRYGDLATIAHL
jgi:hypothetical protein